MQDREIIIEAVRARDKFRCIKLAAMGLSLLLLIGAAVVGYISMQADVE